MAKNWVNLAYPEILWLDESQNFWVDELYVPHSTVVHVYKGGP